MPEFSNTVLKLARTALGKRAQAQEQGGLLDGQDPTAFNTSDPIRLWIIQMGIIILTAQLLSLILRRIRQPKVIAEVLGGILLGPTAFGRIPGFTDHIFPKSSLPYLSLTANIGLVLFLFLVGLEIETSVIKRNARFSMPIAFAGMVLPFGLGTALSVPLYHHFIGSDVKFTDFMVFTGVAYSITAFPVLCRILTELKLIDTTVGIVVLSAGVGNDIVGWTLLALSVALVNGASGLMPLYILLTAIGFALFLLFPVRVAFKWLAYRTGSIENGPSMFFMTVTILMVFASAFFTDIIGVHAIFGGFLAGLVVPREGGLAITMTEKLEDMVSIIFLPLYFTISGLSTNLGLLNNGITWGYTFAIMALAYGGKFGGCAIAARFVGFRWREACTIGSMMSCKGLVELIVLNVGLSAGILSPRVFSMFVLEALVLTFMTTPTVVLLYPPEIRVRATPGGDYSTAVDKAGSGGPENVEKGIAKPSPVGEHPDEMWKSRFTVVLDKIEHLPGMLTLTHLVHHPPPPYTEREVSPEEGSLISRQRSPNVYIDALRLIELSDRTSAVMKSSAADTLIQTDPLLAVFKTFGDLIDLPISSSLSVVTFDDLASRVADHARDNSSHLVLVPWLPPSVNTTQGEGNPPTPAPTSPSHNPFDVLFKAPAVDKAASLVHSQFVRGIFAQASTDVALYVDAIDRTGSFDDFRIRRGKSHILLPFIGGPDDRLALDFVVQLCSNTKITATVVRISKSETLVEENVIDKPEEARTIGVADREGEAAAVAANMRAHGMTVTSMASASGHPDTMYPIASTQLRLQSETADNVAWGSYAFSPEDEHSRTPRVADALSRIEFIELSTPTPLQTIIDQTSSQITHAAENEKNLIVALGRSRRLAAEDHRQELKELMEKNSGVGAEVKRTIGDVATALIVSGCNVGLVVMQAAERPLD